MLLKDYLPEIMIFLPDWKSGLSGSPLRLLRGVSKVGGLPGVVESTYSSKGIPPVLVGVGFDTLVIQSPGLWGVYWYGGKEG